MVDFKKTNAESTTVTRDVRKLDVESGNIYESVAVIAKRANQISGELREELTGKLNEFATHSDNLEEVFENREQIEISKFYERLPKPVSIAMQEFVEGKVYYRNPAREEGNNA
ncbi:MAG: DNA-directed RNA polymerase subunit omega [Bacteroidota bacterium]|jgi:DNA-directed RNA polymerase subunit K/omega